MDSRHRPTIGLLPLMLELYDRSAPDLKPRQAEFARQVADVLGSDIDIAVHDVCNTREQVEAVVGQSETDGCDGIVVLHLSYAPSLISASALTRTDLPLLLLNTTPAPRLGPDLVRTDIMENHGIHGVQDLANILLRAGKKYHIVAGHMSDPSVADKAVRWCHAAMATRFWRKMRVGRIGDPFEGMGDFSVDLTALQSVVGPQVFLVSPNEVAELAQAVAADHVLAEVAEDRERFAPSPDLDPDLHALSVRAGLGLAAAVEQYELDAVSMHFMAFNNTPCPAASARSPSRGCSAQTGRATRSSWPTWASAIPTSPPKSPSSASPPSPMATSPSPSSPSAEWPRDPRPSSTSCASAATASD